MLCSRILPCTNSFNYLLFQFSRNIKYNNLLKKKSVNLEATKHYNESVPVGTLRDFKLSCRTILQQQTFKPFISFVRSASSDNDVVCYGELRKLRKSANVLLIDVRDKEETWRTGTIPGSLCVPFKELSSALNMTPETFEKTYCKVKPSTSDHVIFLCRRGERSFKAMKQAKKLGYKKAKTYQGGFMGWFNQERINRERRSRSTNNSYSIKPKNVN